MTATRPPHNFLPAEYDRTAQPRINHNYLSQQFADYRDIFEKLAELVEANDFTLGRTVDRFERAIAALLRAKHVVGVGSGTDALFLSLKAMGVGPGDEVITTPYTFHSTVGAIGTTGARPVFADIGDDYNLDPAKVEAAITPRTRAILPVHWSGRCCDMDALGDIARRHDLRVVEDACHAINASYKGKRPGTFGDTGCFSMHPLKNLNCWGDGGFIATDSDELHDRLVLLRNHGLVSRDECVLWGFNSRLDTVQAVVALHLLERIDHITERRQAHAKYLDEALADIEGITVPTRDPEIEEVFHIYVVRCERRDALQRYLIEHDVDAKIHYPIPMHLQAAAKDLGYKEGDFPVAEATCKSVLSLPVHEFMTHEDLDYVVTQIRAFYAGS